MSLDQIAHEIGRTPKQTKKLLDKLGWIGVKPKRGAYGRRLSYPAEGLETLKALLGQPHRQIAPSDWLTDFLGGRDA